MGCLVCATGICTYGIVVCPGYRLAKESGLSIIFYEGTRIKNKLGYYSHIAAKERQKTMEVVKEIMPKLYVDACASTGVRGLLASRVVPSVILNDLYVPRALMALNRAINGISAEVKYMQEDVSSLIAKIPREGVVLDLDVYGSALPYLERCPNLNTEYLFLTFTDLMNLCGAPAKRFFGSREVYFLKVSCKYELAIRLLLPLIKKATGTNYRLIDAYRHERYFRLYLTRAQTAYETTRLLYYCHCGTGEIYNALCTICGNYGRCVGPAEVGVIAGVPLSGFCKTEVFGKSGQIPTNEWVLAALSSEGISTSVSKWDNDIIKTNCQSVTLRACLQHVYRRWFKQVSKGSNLSS